MGEGSLDFPRFIYPLFSTHDTYEGSKTSNCLILPVQSFIIKFITSRKKSNASLIITYIMLYNINNNIWITLLLKII